MFADAPSHGKEYHDLKQNEDKYYDGDPKNRDLK
jgi:hypothetical protein